MKTLVSQRHFIKFYLSIILLTLLLSGIATVSLFAYNKQLDIGDLKPIDKLIPIFSIACYAFAVFCLYSYIKNVPTIILDKDFISFNNQTFALADINKIELTGKRPLKYAVSSPMEAATLTFNNGVTKYIFDDMYSNSWEMKSFLKQVVIDKKDFFEVTENVIDTSTLDNDYYETYKGTVITSLRGISFWVVIGISALLILSHSKPITTELVVSFFCILSFWIFFHSYLMNYFQVSDNYFVIRNHNFFWTKKAYRIADIREVVFESRGKMPNCLRIITKDFRNKLYPAGTLRDQTWLDLKEKLETYKIKVRNECI